MTPLKVSIVAGLASVLLILVVLELIRRRSLRERISSSTTRISTTEAIAATMETTSGVISFPPAE